MSARPSRRSLPSPLVLVAIALPLLLALAVAGIAVTDRLGGFATVSVAETGPLAVAPVDAPAAGGPECAALLAALPPVLGASGTPLPSRPIAEPTAPGVLAWAAAPRPVVLRCGLPRPAELGPTSALLVVNRVQWLQLDDGVPDPVIVTYVAVDRPVYVVLTTPVAVGGAPLQEISDALREKLPERPVQIR